MKTLPINPVLVTGRDQPAATQTIHAAEKEQWMQSLTAGQIIKGRVMRQYAEQRYGVSFAGQERIVDSVIPLAVGNSLTGKVLAVSDQSISMRLLAGKLEQGPAQPVSVPKGQSGLQAEMSNAGVQLSQAQQQQITAASKNSSHAQLAMQVGIFLAKLGLPLSMALIDGVLRRVLDVTPAAARAEAQKVVELTELDFVAPMVQAAETASSALPADADPIKQMAALFAQQYSQALRLEEQEHLAEEGHDASQQENQRQSTPSLLQIFNRQTDASVHHRFQTLPIMIDGQLREFDLALFDQFGSDQAGQGSADQHLQSKHLKFSLATAFGQVVLDAHVVNQRVSLQVSAPASMATMLDAHAETLAEAINTSGWKLDRATYTAEAGAVTPARSVMEHVLAQDSLRLVL